MYTARNRRRTDDPTERAPWWLLLIPIAAYVAFVQLLWVVEGFLHALEVMGR